MSNTPLPIPAIARKLQIPDKYFEQLGSDSGKVRLEFLFDPAFQRRGKLIIVTATTPTAAGEGKTVTSISLTQGLAHIGKKVVITSREPSLGPVFGMKGGAAGGGLSEGFAKGGEGAKELAEKVVATIDKNPAPAVHTLYSFDESLTDKIKKVAQQIYGASEVRFSDEAAAKLKQFSEWGYSKLPVCMAKTQYSLSDNPKLLGAPSGWILQVTNASLSAGAGFVVVISGNMMLMPGLPKFSRAASIEVDRSGKIIGI